MRKLFLCLGAGVVVASLNSATLSVKASASQRSHVNPAHGVYLAMFAPDQSALIKENTALLLKNRGIARQIATHLGIESTGEVPTTGTPLEQNQILILQNQDTFRAIAAKVGAKAPPAGAVEGADQAAKNHSILLINKKIVGAILAKLGITPTPPVLKGTFVEKNHTLLLANGAALVKIADKLGVALK
jgi:hypothetical protein